MELTDTAKWPESLRPFFDQPFFTPVSLVGASPRKASCDFFLSGYGIGGLPAERLIGNGWQANEVHIVPTTGERERAYLESVAGVLKSKQPLSFTNGEMDFETFDLQRQISRLAAPPLAESVRSECRSWAAGRKRVWLKIFGTVDLAIGRDGFTELKDCFRFAWRCQDGSLAGWQPFLEVKLESLDEGQDLVRLQVSAESSIWLANPAPVKNSITLGGQMTPAIADEYLNRYTSLCRQLMHFHHARIQSASVGFGDAFWRERDRLGAAFRKGLDNCPVPLDFW